MLSDFFDTMGTLVGVGAQAGYLDEKGHLREAQPAARRRLAGRRRRRRRVVPPRPPPTSSRAPAWPPAAAPAGSASSSACCFLLAMFFSPIAGIVPANATAPALIIVGYLMMATLTAGRDDGRRTRKKASGLVKRAVAAIDFSDIAFGIPAVLIMTIMPLTYSITNGIGFGFISYTIIRISQGECQGDQLDAVDRDRPASSSTSSSRCCRPRAGSEPGLSATRSADRRRGRAAAGGPAPLVSFAACDRRLPHPRARASSSSPRSCSRTAWSGSAAATTWARAPWAASWPPWARRCPRPSCRSSPSSSRAATAGREVGVGAILGAPFMLSSLAMVVTGAAVVVFAWTRPPLPRRDRQRARHAPRPQPLPHRLRLAMVAGLIHVRPLHWVLAAAAARLLRATTCGRRMHGEGDLGEDTQAPLLPPPPGDAAPRTASSCRSASPWPASSSEPSSS